MTHINYILKGFGYKNLTDLSTTLFKIVYLKNAKFTIPVIVSLGTVRQFVEEMMGLDAYILIAFILLIICEFQTGLRVAMHKKQERFKSRKFGRMFLKIAVYMQMLWVLYQFSSKMEAKVFVGFEVNPFGWLYYIVFTGIVFQMVISYLENLSALGYDEAKGLHGAVLRKFNKWFEFDGTKDGDNI